MKNTLALLVLAGVTTTSLTAPAQPTNPPATTAAPPAVPTTAAPEEAKKAKDLAKEPSMVVYATAVPFAEYVNQTDATQPGFAEGPGHIGTANTEYDGTSGPSRGRMTPGTSHLGVRGSYPLFEQLRIIGQIETGMAIEGNPNPWEPTVPSRNSYGGFAGGWGTLVFGYLDTPYKWATLTTINPIKAGYVSDYTPLMGSPGFRASALNKATNWVNGSGDSNTAFYRREANSIQYWSPTVFGFYGRFSYTLNEIRPEDSQFTVRSNPYVVSFMVGFDFRGLRLRYAWESHHDYYGLSYMYNEFTDTPSPEIRTANDWGNKVVLQYTLTINDNIKTRFAGIGEHLKYTMQIRQPGAINSYWRPAFYVLLEQEAYKHHVWGAYGRAYPGECARVPQPTGVTDLCTTHHIGAQLFTAGYMYSFTENADAFLMGYRLVNQRSGLYVTSPPLPVESISPGLDYTGVGVGLRYTFDAELL